MDVHVQLILSLYIVNLAKISGLLDNQPLYQFKNPSFDLIENNTHKRSDIYYENLKQRIVKKQEAFDTMREELLIAQIQNNKKKRNYVENIVAVKRETDENDHPESQTSESSNADVVTQLHEKVQHHTNLLDRVWKIIPDVRDVMAAANPPLKETSLRRYEKELNEIHAVIGELSSHEGLPKNSSVNEIMQLLEKTQNQTEVFRRVSKIFPNVRKVLIPAEPPKEDSLRYHYIKELDEIQAAIGKLSNVSESSSVDELVKRLERVQGQTKLLKRAKKLIPELRDILVPANPPWKDTLIYQYVKELDLIEAGVSKLSSVTKCSSADDAIGLLEKAEKKTTTLLKKFKKLIPELRDIMVPANPPWKDTLIYRWVKEIDDIEATAKKLLVA